MDIIPDKRKVVGLVEQAGLTAGRRAEDKESRAEYDITVNVEAGSGVSLAQRGLTEIERRAAPAPLRAPPEPRR